MKSTLSLRRMTEAALMAALLAILSQIQIPLPSGVPVTLQTFGVALMGAVLGRRTGTLSILVYLMMGLVGLPVFAGFGGGAGVLAGPTGGFLIGFVPMAFCCGVGTERPGRIARMALSMVGLLCCHLCAVLYFMPLMGVGLLQSAATMTLPYILKDAVSVALAVPAGGRIRRQIAGLSRG